MSASPSTLPTQLVPFLWHFLRKYRGWYLTSLSCGLFWALENAINPYLLKYIVDFLAEYGGDRLKLWDYLLLPVVAYAGMWVIRIGSIRLSDLCTLKIYPAMKHDIIVDMFAYLNKHSHQFFQDNFAGSLQNKIGDMALGASSIIKKVDETISQAIMVLVAIITMICVHPLFGAILSLWLLIFITICVVFSKEVQRRSKDFSEARSKHVGKIVDSIGNVLNTRLFARRHYETDYVSAAIKVTRGKDQAMQAFILRLRLLWDVTFLALMVGMLCLLIHMYRLDQVTLGDFIFIMGLSRAVVYPVWWLATQMIEFSSDIGKCQQALSIVSAPHQVTDQEQAQPLSLTQGDISFRNVSFHYQKTESVFENVSVDIPAGQKVGLVGYSGAGKSTFVNLLLRFYDLDEGQILIDEQDIATVSQDSLREHLAMIPQDTSLFHRTLLENIRYGRLEASDEEVYDAAQKSFCHQFILDLPEQYESLVGERGVKLSGGQRQRIAIARAMLKDAPILILDEATSALDSVTEHAIQQGLENLMIGRTSIVIAHRLSTLSQMDRILVFDQGRIIEDGSPDELRAANGHYAQMWNMQAGGFIAQAPSDSLSPSASVDI